MPSASTSDIASNLTPISRLRGASNQRISHSAPTTGPTTGATVTPPTPPTDPTAIDPTLGLGAPIPPEASAEHVKLLRERIRRTNELEEISHREAKRQAIRESRLQRDADRAADSPTTRVRTPKVSPTTSATQPVSSGVYMSPASRAAYDRVAQPPGLTGAYNGPWDPSAPPETVAAYRRLAGPGV